VLNRRASRVAVSGFLLAVAVSGLTACRTSPNVAAYVGDEQVTVPELEAAVDERTADDEIAAFASGREAEFDQQVLNILIQEQVHTVAAERYGVEVTDAQVRSRIDTLLGDDDPDAVFSQLAQQGISRQDVFETVRQQLIRREIALAEGEVEEPSEEALQAQYEEAREGLAEVSFGYINVPDQATADALQAQLQADPSRYAAAAAQFEGPYTLPELEQRSLEEVPGPLAEQVANAQPNTAFTLAVEEVGGVLVTFVEGTVYPTFEELRPQLEQEFSQAADAAGAALVDEVRDDLDVTANPRFGDIDDAGQLGPIEGGVVQILGDEPAEGSAESTEGADGGTGG
jgi:uncharacterized protein YbaA (DUF1428 family)